ncbi:MAG: thioredoxin domain-containing protein [Patescibacteria group bacterium]|nr:thioredoxin domain-containing protein [Patescibacteria group bacterium]
MEKEKNNKSSKKEKKGKGILDAPPKNTFIMGLLVGLVFSAVVGITLSLTVFRSVSDNDSESVAGVEDTADTDADTDTAVEESNVSPTNIMTYASEIGLDTEKFNECMSNGDKTDTVTQSQSEATELGVNGTPATFINGYLVSGALPKSEFDTIIDEILAGSAPTSQYVAEGEPVDIKIADDDNIRGSGNKLIFVEYSDFECPYCTRHAPTMEELYQEYKDQAKFVFRHFPLTSIHQNAQIAAEAAECAADQGKFWEMHNKMFAIN